MSQAPSPEPPISQDPSAPAWAAFGDALDALNGQVRQASVTAAAVGELTRQFTDRMIHLGVQAVPQLGGPASPAEAFARRMQVGAEAAGLYVAYLRDCGRAALSPPPETL
jgi:hypothetical protein